MITQLNDGLLVLLQLGFQFRSMIAQIVVVDLPFIEENTITLIVGDFQLIDLALMFIDERDLLLILLGDLNERAARVE